MVRLKKPGEPDVDTEESPPAFRHRSAWRHQSQTAHDHCRDHGYRSESSVDHLHRPERLEVHLQSARQGGARSGESRRQGRRRLDGSRYWCPSSPASRRRTNIRDSTTAPCCCGWRPHQLECVSRSPSPMPAGVGRSLARTVGRRRRRAILGLKPLPERQSRESHTSAELWGPVRFGDRVHTHGLALDRASARFVKAAER